MNVKNDQAAAVPARTTKAEQSEATRSALVAAARPLFAERGYAGVGTEEIVRAAGVTRGALYHHFGGKDDLFAAVYEQVEAELVPEIGLIGLVAGGPDGRRLGVDDEHGSRRRVAQDAVRDAPQQGACQAEAARAHHDQVVAAAVGLAEDRLRGRSMRQDGGDGEVVGHATDRGAQDLVEVVLEGRRRSRGRGRRRPGQGGPGR